jgi:hypothetical protein
LNEIQGEKSFFRCQELLSGSLDFPSSGEHKFSLQCSRKKLPFFPVLYQITSSKPLHHVSSISVLILSSPCTSASPKRSLFSHVLKPECCTHLSLIPFRAVFPAHLILDLFCVIRPNSFVLVDKTNFQLYCPSRHIAKRASTFSQHCYDASGGNFPFLFLCWI